MNTPPKNQQSQSEQMSPGNEISFMNKDIFVSKTPKSVLPKKIRARNSNRLEKLERFDFFDFESNFFEDQNIVQ